MKQVTTLQPQTNPDTFPPVPLPNSYWVSPRMLLAGGYPVGMDLQRTGHQIDLLLAAGIRTFINLVEEGSCNVRTPPYPVITGS